MTLTREGIKSPDWQSKAWTLPSFDIDKLGESTRAEPNWIHFGAGNIFRSFISPVVQDMIDRGLADKGIIAVGGRDSSLVEGVYRPHDNLSILVTLKSDGSIKKSVIGSVVESLTADSDNEKDWARLLEVFRTPSLQIVSFTITEKGYLLRNASGSPMPGVQEDFAAGPVLPKSYMGKIATLLHERFLHGQLPVAMVNMDNCSHNGDKLHAAVNGFASEWERLGVCKPGFLSYVNDRSKVSFPWTMIDKITPRPDAKIEKTLADDGLEGLESIVTSTKTYVAPFVNAEECQYLVMEDAFPNGRPALEKAGIYLTNRETVDKVEKMKVCTCLNPLHTFLALSGCLLGYTLIADEMKDKDLLRLVKRLGYDEGLPVVTDPGIISPRDFIDEVVNVRIPNPFLPDSPQRIACDTSQKIPIRFGETIKGYLARKDLDVGSLRVVPLTFALWLRYLMAVDDEGRTFEPSPDPLLDEARSYVKGLTLGCNGEDAVKSVEPLLHRADIFGVDLEESGLAEQVKVFFSLMISCPGAVRETLKNTR
ncbi:MAG: mannitol dehydrogenase family protein [Treponema sp.]|nr:mannitol dehydrogenase family protein [Treponema sp.]